MSESGREKKPYAKYAFLNPYNLSVLAGTVTAGALTGQWWLAAVGAGAEALWMLFAPDSKILQRAWFDKYWDEEKIKEKQEALNKKFRQLPPVEESRCRGLAQRRDQIFQLAQGNPAFTHELLGDELSKLDRLVEAFLDLSLTTSRYANYLSTVDPRQIAYDRSRYTHLLSLAEEDDRRRVAEQNIAVLDKRTTMVEEMTRDMQTAMAQLDLIENTFKLLADQIVTMRSSAELSNQLDGVIQGVEAVRISARETDSLMAGIEDEVSESENELRRVR